MTPDEVARLSSVVEFWLPRYPFHDPPPWYDPGALSDARKGEDRWLGRMAAGEEWPTEEQVCEMIDWKWQGTSGRFQRFRRLAKAAISGDNWTAASQRIIAAVTASDPSVAMDTLYHKTGGIPDWTPPTASVILAVRLPNVYTVVDSYALQTRMLVQRRHDDRERTRRAIDRTGYFPRDAWEKHLAFCREGSNALGISLRDLDRAMWSCAGADHADGWQLP